MCGLWLCRGVLVLVFVERYGRILMASASGMFWWRKTSAGGSSPTTRPLLSTACNSMCSVHCARMHVYCERPLLSQRCTYAHTQRAVLTFEYAHTPPHSYTLLSTACACHTNVRVCTCTHTSTHASTWGFYVFAVWPCSPPVWEQRQIVYAELILNKRRRLVKPSQIILPSQEFSN